MAIIGLTDRGASFPQLGTLRKGAKKPNEKRPGEDLKHFRFDTGDEAAASLFAEIYGAEPNTVRVFLPFSTLAENWEAWREEWSAGALKHRCDGQTCVRSLTPAGKYSDEPRPCPGGCKPSGRLKVIVPDLRRLAYVTVLTTSIHDIIQITENLAALEAARGDLKGIPMLLRRVPRMISTPTSEGGRARREKWLITIEAAPQWVDLQLAAQQQAALPAGSMLALPPAPDDDDDDDDDLVGAEVGPPASGPDRGSDEASAEERKINALLKGHCLREKKNEKAAQAYFDALFGRKTLAEKRQAAIDLKLTAPAAASDDALRDGLIREIEGRLFKDLQALGRTGQEMIEKIARICEGEVGLEDMSIEQLTAIKRNFELWRDKLRSELQGKVA